VIEFAQLRGRCVMTTYDPDTQKKDPAVLRHIVKKFDGTLALDTDIIKGGQIEVGDAVELIE
ncbi:MAG: MOSC domain-containing protein, partial [Chloroflexi bacterium CFX2]|nr:MOSC domain-containing protein [Chloroflexi bacterium CFX2]